MTTHDPMTDETYLGNGLYASFDGNKISLGSGGHRVALEPSTYHALVTFAERHWPLPKEGEIETMSRKLTQFLIEHFQREDAQAAASDAQLKS
jgi:hypothetical protein